MSRNHSAYDNITAAQKNYRVLQSEQQRFKMVA